MATATTANGHAWIVAELLKLCELERSFANIAKARALAPPELELAVLYHEIADHDDKHVKMLETIAIRYGSTPSRSSGAGVGETLGRFKDIVGEIGTSSIDRVRHDLLTKSDILHQQTAWVHAFESLGDTASVRDLSTILNEEQTHHEALLQSLTRMIEHQVLEKTSTTSVV